MPAVSAQGQQSLYESYNISIVIKRNTHRQLFPHPHPISSLHFFYILSSKAMPTVTPPQKKPTTTKKTHNNKTNTICVYIFFILSSTPMPTASLTRGQSCLYIKYRLNTQCIVALFTQCSNPSCCFFYSHMEYYITHHYHMFKMLPHTW